MVSTRKLFQAISAITVLLADFAGAAGANAQSFSELRSAARSPHFCREVDPIRNMRGTAEQFDRVRAARGGFGTAEPCDASHMADRLPVARREIETTVLVRHEDALTESPDLGSGPHGFPAIRASGAEATAITRANTAVLAILQSNNSCSAWFSQADRNVAETFASLNLWIERDGPDHIVQERNDRGDWIEHGPYIARTSERTGHGTNVAINASGAFFHAKAEVYKIAWQGGEELPTNTWQALHVGPFYGATGQAQIITILHELAHVVGAIPADGLSPAGLTRSQENTELVLKHCKSAVNANANHPVIQLAQKLPE